MTVDEKRRRSAHTERFRLGDIRIDRALSAGAVEVRFKSLHVQTELARILKQGLTLNLRLIREEFVVILPEFALIECGRRCEMGQR